MLAERVAKLYNYVSEKINPKPIVIKKKLTRDQLYQFFMEPFNNTHPRQILDIVDFETEANPTDPYTDVYGAGLSGITRNCLVRSMLKRHIRHNLTGLKVDELVDVLKITKTYLSER